MPLLSRVPGSMMDDLSLVSGDRRLTFRDLEGEADLVARRLVTLGVREGDVVALKGHPDVDLLAALHGIWKVGGVPFPMNPRWMAAEEERAVAVLGPKVGLLGTGMPPIAGCPESLLLGGSAHAGEGGLHGVRPDSGPLPELPEPPDAMDGYPAAHLLTSGTEGEARAVTLTFGNLRASAGGATERLSLGPSDRWLASLSPAHVGGLALAARGVLVPCILVLDGGFDALRLRDLLIRGEVTHASLVPTQLLRLLECWGERRVPESVRCLLVGGARAEEPLVAEALARGFPVALTYGLTEAASQVATAPPRLVRSKPGCVGPPLQGVEVKVSASGEILVRGGTVAPALADREGWLHTGDLGRLDEDGHLRVTGRISHRIVSGGVNVDPVEVEDVLRTHPGVGEAVVVGVPDPEWGEKVVAAVLPSEGTGIDLQEMDRLCRAVLSAGKRPRGFRILEEIPRNANGKVDRGRIRALFR